MVGFNSIKDTSILTLSLQNLAVPDCTRCSSPSLACLEESTYYLGISVPGTRFTTKPSARDCQQSCADSPHCHYWSWDKRRLRKFGNSDLFDCELIKIDFANTKIFLVANSHSGKSFSSSVS